MLLPAEPGLSMPPPWAKIREADVLPVTLLWVIFIFPLLEMPPPQAMPTASGKAGQSVA
ncbi:hypothetical protein Slala02_54960 [Streptomyces lavendulae subsp. lavendulae]|nr:hypothetical protein Slala01_56120 [Streptomyces lavendulae subsp. lavendulae]GLX29676.1 hypothetical protein Slala02_54960 [Streptomyces lavendulae subsp. lavendulae]